MFTKIILKRNDIIIFLILALIVIFLQFTLLGSALKIGFKPDDWMLYFAYKTLGSHPLSKLFDVWMERGAYTTYQVYYMGLLEKLAGFNYHSFQVINLIFKSLGTIAVYPLVLIIFRNRSLSILTTLFFAISYSSIGPLEFAVKGSDYLAIFWMGIFLIVYYLIIKKHPRNFLWLSIDSLLFILAITFSPIRLFPLMILLPLIELFIILRYRSLENFKNALIRIWVLYFPFIALILYSPNSISGLLQAPSAIFNKIIQGDKDLLLYPFSGIGYTFIAGQYLQKIFGSIRSNTIGEYTFFLLGGPTVIFGILTFILAFSKFKNHWFFFLFTFSLNFFLEISVYFIASHDQVSLYAVFFGIYILVLGFACFIEWIKDGRDDLILALWTGVLFLFIFTFSIWAFAPIGTTYSGTSYYLVVSAIGTSLIISAFIISFYRRVMHIKNFFLKFVATTSIFVVMIFISLMDSNEIRSRINYLLANGRSAHEQQMIQNRFREKIKDINLDKPTLFYFDTSEVKVEEMPFYSEGFLVSFPSWMYFQGGKLVNGCIEGFYDNKKKLFSLIKVNKDKKVISYLSTCVEGGQKVYKDVFYEMVNFYAFKIKNKDFIDIRQEILNKK